MLSPFDARFGPQLPGQFDFTICFEHVIFKIVPGVLAIGTIPVYVNIVLREKRRVRPGFILSSKAIVGSTLVGLCTASLATWQSSSLLQSGITVAATAVTFAASLGILSILYVAHSYSLQPSSFLSVFLAITALLDGAVARSYFRRGGMDGLAALEIAMAVVKFILVILEEFSKRSLFYSAELRSSTSTETVAGFWNRATFGWFNCLMLFAFRNTLTLDGLPKIDEAFDSAPLYNRFLPVWDRGKYNLCPVYSDLLTVFSRQTFQIRSFSRTCLNSLLGGIRSRAAPTFVYWVHLLAAIFTISHSCRSRRWHES